MLDRTGQNFLKKEAIRYLGYGRTEADEQILAMIDQVFAELEQVAHPKSIYQIYDLDRVEGTIQFGEVTIHSSSLERNLKGCERIVLFGATLGIGVDQLMARRAVTDMAKTVVMQACAAALLEQYCDACQEEIAKEVATEGYFLRPRFSPGYGDFSIHFQKDLIRILDCTKKIGLTITESCMMTPVKSVTAVIGVSSRDAGCKGIPCEECSKTDCKYRRI